MTNKTNKSGRNAFAERALVIALICILGLATACKNDSTKPWDTVTVEFVALGIAGDTTINFSPSAALPKGVTYVLTDDKGSTWNSESFNGQVSANTYDTEGNITFTQTFYLKGDKLTGAGSQRTVIVVFDTFPDPYFMVIITDSGSVTLVHP